MIVKCYFILFFYWKDNLLLYIKLELFVGVYIFLIIYYFDIRWYLFNEEYRIKE